MLLFLVKYKLFEQLYMQGDYRNMDAIDDLWENVLDLSQYGIDNLLGPF